MKKVIFSNCIYGFRIFQAMLKMMHNKPSKIIGTWKIISNKVENGETVMASESSPEASPSLKVISPDSRDTQLIEGSAEVGTF